MGVAICSIDCTALVLRRLADIDKDFRYSRLDWQTNSNSASAHGPFAGRGRSRAAGKTSADAYVFNVILHNFDMS